MSNKIEQIIDEIEDYIENCKYQPFSNSRIVVDKDEIEDLLSELRRRMPDEIKRYQRMISNKEAILNDARTKAEALINEATVHTNELINEHEIMQQAYAKANEVVSLASHQAQEILDNATIEANNMRAAAIQYTDEMLANLENMMVQTMNMTTSHYESFINNLNGYAEVIRSNRGDLRPQETDSLLGGTANGADGESLNLDLLK